ncbi:MAG: tetratricopeptide repeat protein [Bacteroidota bacterium]
MLNNNKFVLLTLLFVLLFAGNGNLFAGSQNISATRAMQLFDAGEYEAAEIAFRQLLEDEPGNTMLNYYFAASRTENGHYSENDLNTLLGVIKDATPHRINYYLGVQYHARNNWEQALKYYNQYRNSVTEEDREEVQLTQKIQQCYDRVNPFAEQEATPPTEIVEQEEKSKPITDQAQTIEPEKTVAETDEEKNVVVTVKEDSLMVSARVPQPLQTKLISTPRKNLPDLPGVKATYTPLSGEPVEFQVNNKITYLNTAHFKTEKGKELFLEGKKLQDELNQQIEKADELRSEYRTTQDAERKSEIGDEILTIENESYQIRENIMHLFSESRQHENNYWQHAGEIAVNNFIIELDKMKRAREQATVQNREEETGTPLLISASDLFNISEPGSQNREEENDNELVYKIQIGAYSRGLPSYVERKFNKLSLIRKIDNYTDEDGVVVYTTGNLSNLDDAIKMQNQVRQEGIEDAFVVPYFNGKRITLEQAKKIEAEDDNERD